MGTDVVLQPAGDGPSLQAYVETRFNLLVEAAKERERTHESQLLAIADSTKVALQAIKAAAEAAQIATDLRYQQRFEAQSDALAAAFLSQQTAMQTAFVVAEKAVQAALAAADRAVSKAELAADKRFEALNELRQMLTDMVGSLISKDEVSQRLKAITDKIDANKKSIETIEGRLNMQSGERAGQVSSGMNTRANIAMGISLIIVLLALLGFLFARLGK